MLVIPTFKILSLQWLVFKQYQRSSWSQDGIYAVSENHTTTLWFKKLERSSNLVLYKHFKHDLKRKDYMLKVLELEVDQLRNKAKFIRIKRLYHENTMMLGNLLDQRLDTRHRKVI
ncbi:uncharacterized protein OCT59_009592 [Rhizophagus irregularis]|uniref:uncharacterized protein n=1 Tax=Rhizophagus irregularis TaxID=588596 RepID=UPI000CB193D9|nr:hypothetical protein OCT59_009592 [Rhizophagus irregularis]